jgi:serine beta-lactamase-like protein LACTB
MVKRLRLACLLAIFLAAAPTFGLQPERVRAIGRAVTAEMARQRVPGMSVAVATGGRLQWSSGYGLADVENKVAAKSSTVYRLGSISKPITAVAVLQLAERGKLDLDAAVQKYVPSFPEKPWPITIRQLLGHLGGIRHYRNMAEMNSTRHYNNMLEPLRIFENDPLVAEPGTRFSYSTYGYVLLGAVVEAASGTRFTDYIRENIFRPAGMDNIQPDDVYAIIPHRARGYRISSGGKLQNCALADTSNKIPGGGLSSTAADLVKFAIATRDDVLLKPETVTLMFTPQKLRNGRKTKYGMGWYVIDADRTKHVYHSGGQQGVSTDLVMLPREGAIVAVMCNLERATLSPLCAKILGILRQ